MGISKTTLPDVAPKTALIGEPELPDFTQYTQVKEKKSAFFAFMLPLVEQENQRIAALRVALMGLKAEANQLTGSEEDWLQELAGFYRIKDAAAANEKLISDLLLKVDTIPPSLALSQSANESAWGTSRFAVKGNNLFGQWCFKKGCGIVPSGRDNGANHEVAKFSSPRQSVQSYIHNLNTNAAYIPLRALRATNRKEAKPVTGQLLAQGLLKYSSRGEAYVDELQQMIRINKLGQYDTL
ncbi:hypothetical protein BST96_19050 [Oceanicoccus sagamiensis]|uniref:Mannosyl-glycoprotein endo-beta-N-acetylglucosamidase-like domain-containing protein n=2 Tax=Oceanicoccus sagamiensis TaxID=716816 RepID=A0A1X9NHN1_9GAMM|nr:hypothetical protein BST96_19050 [Oceanicoccus sagamiensis]